MKEKYHKYLISETKLGSSAIDCYLRSMDMIDRVLISSSDRSIWDIQDIDLLRQVLNIIMAAELNPERSIFRNEGSLSYLRNGFCKAALKWYIEFMVGAKTTEGAYHRHDCTVSTPQTTTPPTYHEKNNGYPDIVREINNALDNGCTDTQCIPLLHTVPNGDVVWEKVFCRSMGKMRFKSDAWKTFGRFARQSNEETRQRLIWKTCKERGLIDE